MPLAALVFSLFACLLVAVAGRREHTPRLTAASILLLLALPALSLLPKWGILPIAAPPGTAPGGLPSVLPEAIWAAGTVLLLARLATSLLTVRRWRRDSQLLGRVELGVGRPAELRLLEAIDGPVAAGIRRPVIFLPVTWRNWSEEDREIVLAHERSHLLRRDPLWRFLGALACALHWFNPFVWWLARRHALHSEYACDAFVLRSGIDPRRYARLLCDFACGGRTPAPSVAMAHKSCLRSRIERLLSPPGAISPSLSAFLLLATVGAALAVSLVRRADAPASAPVPAEEVRLRLSADPFPGNP